jgi:hypothetical protein
MKRAKNAGDEPLSVALEADPGSINAWAAWLYTLEAHVTVTRLSSRRSKLKAKVPQKHAGEVVAAIRDGKMPVNRGVLKSGGDQDLRPK